jgi:hypothetical protein
MPYGEVISRSFTIWWRHKYLWLLGALAGGGGAAGPNFNFFNIPTGFNTGANNTAPSGATSPGSQSGVEFANWFAAHIGLLLAIAGVIVLVFLVLFVISCIAAPALIEAAAWHDGEERFTFGRAWNAGRTFFWRFLGFRLLFLLLTLVVFAVYGTLILLTIVAFSNHATAVAVILVLLDVLLAIVGFFGLLAAALVGQLAMIALVLERLGVIAAIHRGIERFRQRIWRVLLVWLIQIGVSLAVGFVVVFAYIPLGLVGFGVGVAAYNLGGVPGLVAFGVVAAIVFVAVTWLLGGLISSYFSIYWTLAYRRLDRESPPQWLSAPPYPYQPAR